MGDCVGASPPQTPIWSVPPAPGGDERPGDGVPAPPPVPRIRRHNLIPSGLCNNRQIRQLHESTKVIVQALGTRYNVLPGGRLHNPDYVKKAPSEGCEGFPFDLPGEAAAGKVLAAVAGPSPALCQPRTWQRNWGPVPPNSSTPVQLRISGINMQPTSPASPLVQCEHPAALCPSGGSLRL